jgi:hypothetical protein
MRGHKELIVKKSSQMASSTLQVNYRSPGAGSAKKTILKIKTEFFKKFFFQFFFCMVKKRILKNIP